MSPADIKKDRPQTGMGGPMGRGGWGAMGRPVEFKESSFLGT